MAYQLWNQIKSNQMRIDDFQELFNRNKKVILNQNLNYLHPTSHLITHQIGWFKGSYYSGLRSDIKS